MNKNLIKLTAGGIVTFCLFLFALACTERIDAGHEGLLVKMYGSDKGYIGHRPRPKVTTRCPPSLKTTAHEVPDFRVRS